MTVRAVAQLVPGKSITVFVPRVRSVDRDRVGVSVKTELAAPGLHRRRAMHALDFEGELLSTNERPTIPVPAPRESGVRLRVARKSVQPTGVTVELVVCDLTRDQRSEEYVADDQRDGGPPQTVRQPAMTNIRALCFEKK